ncbi:MAG: EAL domain-containing protein [Vicinamibacteria bacterium]|nr:EAL domain-containing protein [Vicinamibacteria bacterium]
MISSLRLRRLATALVFAVTASGGAAQPVAETPVPSKLVYAGDARFPPFEYLDAQGQPRGFNVELVRMLCAEAGCTVEFQLGAWRDAIGALDSGAADLASLADSADRRQRYDLLAQTWTMHQSVLFRGGRDRYPRSLRELSGETVALLENGAIHEALRALPAGDRPAFRLVGDQYQAVQALVAGESSAVAGNGLTLRHVAAQLGVTDLFEVEVVAAGYFLSARRGRGAELRALAEAYERLLTSGRITALIERSLVLPSRPLTLREQLRRAAVPLLALAGVAVLALGWSTLLRRQVRQRTAQLSQSLVEKERLAEALAAGERRFRGILEDVHLGVLLFDSAGKIVFANPSALDLLAVEPAALLGQSSLACAGALSREGGQPVAADAEPAALALARGRAVHRELLALDGKHGRRWLVMHADPLEGEDGRPSEVICTFADVTEDRRLREERERFFEIAPTVHLVVGRDRRIRHANPAAHRVLGLEPASLVGTRVYDLVHPEDVDKIRAAVQSLAHGVSDVELRCRHADGSWRWLLWNAVADRSQDLVFTIGLDVTERRQAEQQVHHLAYHDTLTGLPNRALLLDRLHMAIARAHRHGEHLAVFFVDLDHFKVINDSLGHSVGDLLLQEIGARLRRALREEDTVARLGGDEFTLIVPGVSEAAALSALARKIQRAVKEPVQAAGRELTVSASIGLGLYPADGTTPEALLQNADVAMYRAKELGRDTFQFHTPALSARVREQLDLEGRLRKALAGGELELYYQPIVALASLEVEGWEALLRWQDPTRGLIGPDEFVPLAEATGLIVPIGRWVLERACRDAVRIGRGRMNVNLSARQLQADELLEDVVQVLRETGLPAQRLELEITESAALQDQERTADTLRAIRALGVSVVMDDFGTGYSSLGHLRRLPIDGVKIDRSFVADLGHADPRAEGIISAVCAMARSLGLRTVAEGVETDDQLARIRAAGCDFAQGYLLGRPAPLAAGVGEPAETRE